MAGSTEALGGTCQCFLNSEASKPFPDQTDFAQLSVLPCIPTGKEQSSMSGWVPAPRERCPGSCWLLKGVAAYSPVPREQEGSAEEMMQDHRRTLAPSPVRTWRLNATNLLWFLNEIKVMR